MARCTSAFHAGHAAFLARARSLGDYLIAGVHADALVSEVRGDAFPVMNMQERVLSVLSNRSVDDVLVDAPDGTDARDITPPATMSTSTVGLPRES